MIIDSCKADPRTSGGKACDWGRRKRGLSRFGVAEIVNCAVTSFKKDKTGGGIHESNDHT